MTSDSIRNTGRKMLVVSAGIFLSKSLGLVRDISFAHVWGTDTALAAFILAFTIPNLFRSMLGEGGMNAAFVPLFTEKLKQEGTSAAWTAACRILSVVTMVLCGAVIVLILLTLGIREIFSSEIADETFRLLPWLLPYAILVCLAAGLGSVLNSVNRFAIPAFSQTLINVCLITATVIAGIAVKDQTSAPIFPLTIAVIAAGVLQLIIHLIACGRIGWIFRFAPAVKSPEVKRFAMLITPVLIGAGVMQINVLVDRFLAGYLGSTATTTLYYSQRLVYLPVGLFGVSMGIVSVPAMSRAFQSGDRNSVLQKLHFSFLQVLFLTIPVMAMLYVLRSPIIRLLFERGAFTVAATGETASVLLFYAVGIPAFVCVKIARTPYHALQNTKTPVKIAAVCVLLNLILNIILMQTMEQRGLALSTSICSWINLLFLLFLVRPYFDGQLQFKNILFPIFKMFTAGVIGGVIALWISNSINAETGLAIADKIIDVIVPGIGGGIVYLAVTIMLGCGSLKKIAARVQ